MPKRTRKLIDMLQIRLAGASVKRGARRGRFLSSKRGMTFLLGVSLSVGGVSEAFNDVHFLVRKDLDQVRVVEQSRSGSKVVARIRGQFAANSVYKLSRFLPDRYISQELNLFDHGWLASRDQSSGFGQKLTFINDSIRREFFSATIPFGALIHAKAEKYEVDPALVAAVMETESRFIEGARSGVGAQGLMQLMPRTGQWMGARNLYDPDQNVDAGVKYLKYLEGRFDGDLTHTIAAYNAGEGTVKRYGGVPPYRETRSYVKKVLLNYQKRNHQMREFEKKSAALPVPPV